MDNLNGTQNVTLVDPLEQVFRLVMCVLTN